MLDLTVEEKSAVLDKLERLIAMEEGSAGRSRLPLMAGRPRAIFG
jgi:hypothetical protein